MLLCLLFVPMNDKFAATSYHQITRFIQGYVDNEINLNPDESCKQTCWDYKKTRNHKCGGGTLCADSVAEHQATKCNGTIYNCEFIDDDLTICPVSFISVCFFVHFCLYILIAFRM